MQQNDNLTIETFKQHLSKLDKFSIQKLDEIMPQSSNRSIAKLPAPLRQVHFRQIYLSANVPSVLQQHASVLNSLPASVLKCDSLTLFKARLKTYLFPSVFS